LVVSLFLTLMALPFQCSNSCFPLFVTGFSAVYAMLRARSQSLECLLVLAVFFLPPSFSFGARILLQIQAIMTLLLFSARPSLLLSTASLESSDYVRPSPQHLQNCRRPLLMLLLAAVPFRPRSSPHRFSVFLPVILCQRRPVSFMCFLFLRFGSMLTDVICILVPSRPSSIFFLYVKTVSEGRWRFSFKFSFILLALGGDFSAFSDISSSP